MHPRDREVNEDPVEKHDNKPPNLVEPPQYNSRYLHVQRKEDMCVIRAMNAAQRPQSKSPSNMELNFSSPETIPNASDNDQEDNKSLSSSITSTDVSHDSERSRLQNLTPPRTRVIDECNIETHTDVNKKRTLTDADGDIREHTWESNSDHSKCDYTTRQPKGKAKPNSNEIDSNTTALVEPSLDLVQPDTVNTPAAHIEPVTTIEPEHDDTLETSTPVPPAKIDSIPVTRTAVQLYGYRRTFGSDRGRSEPSDS